MHPRRIRCAFVFAAASAVRLVVNLLILVLGVLEAENHNGDLKPDMRSSRFMAGCSYRFQSGGAAAQELAPRAGFSTGLSTRTDGDFEMYSLSWAYAW